MPRKIITKQCEVCNKYFNPRDLRKSNKYCSIECYRFFQRSGKYKILVNRTGFYKKCKTCGKNFYVTNSQYGIRHFCCRDCYLEDHKEKKETRKCSGCGKNITRPEVKFRYEKAFCSNECRRKEDRVLSCVVCDSEFCAIDFRKANNEKGFLVTRPFRKTCSEKCHFEYYKINEKRKEKISKALSGDKHHNYKNGASFNYRVRKTDLKENFGSIQKKEVFSKFKNKCFKCGSKEDLTIDHHLPFSMGGRLTFTNCVVLCRSCNSRKNAKHPRDFYSTIELKKLDKIGISENSLFSIGV